ncbi:cupin-like domain-containing protein [Sphingomonas sp. QA11]|uniref:cupin-like domain-containing protein n=1 Tax=Sphingomonas sp. QA11 TaxID=2950605 RepID=UPI00234A6CE1|nr:cupin-like domain-containing protein [Sphingomonas sp. QA11]WCM28419.1 cupin-like domain-containing protein [Sphingomonas sp. QA11]
MTAVSIATRSDRLDALPPVPTASVRSSADIAALLAAGMPVIVKGLVEHWPALAAGRRSQAALGAYFRAMDRGAPVPVMEASPGSGGRFGYAADLREFSFTKRQRPLGETLDRIERATTTPGAPYIAIQMLPLGTQFPDFARDNPMPLVPPAAEPRLWLGGPVKTQIHNDRDHNLACVIAGQRRFLLFPPEQVANLYVGPLDNPPPLSLVDPEAPDFDRFPRFREALDAARVAHLDPGDALLMPRYWWHHVTSRAPWNAMVNYWWGDVPRGLGHAQDAFLSALLAIKALPPSERRYWRAMFEAHVFDDSGDAVAHIPPALRGQLGEMRADQRADLRRQLRMTILKSS